MIEKNFHTSFLGGGESQIVRHERVEQEYAVFRAEQEKHKDFLLSTSSKKELKSIALPVREEVRDSAGILFRERVAEIKQMSKSLELPDATGLGYYLDEISEYIETPLIKDALTTTERKSMVIGLNKTIHGLARFYGHSALAGNTMAHIMNIYEVNLAKGAYGIPPENIPETVTTDFKQIDGYSSMNSKKIMDLFAGEASPYAGMTTEEKEELSLHVKKFCRDVIEGLHHYFTSLDKKS